MLTYFFLDKQRIGRQLPQYLSCVYKSDMPFQIFGAVSKSEKRRREKGWKRNVMIDNWKIFEKMSAPTKIHARAVCKKWFNDMNEEKMWEDTCRRDGFIQIHRFTWMQVSPLLPALSPSKHPSPPLSLSPSLYLSPTQLNVSVVILSTTKGIVSERFKRWQKMHIPW